MKELVLSLVLLTSVATRVHTLPSGAPAAACDTLTQQHGGVTPQTSPIPYQIDLSPFDDGDGGFAYEPGRAYECK